MYNMERFTFNNDTILIAMILFIILLLLRTIFYFMSLTNFKHIFISKENFEKFRNILTEMLNFLLLLIALFILFLRKNNSIFAVILAIIIIVKTILRLFVDFELYRYTNLSDNTIKMIKEQELRSVFVSNAVLFIVTMYMLKTIFIK